MWCEHIDEFDVIRGMVKGERGFQIPRNWQHCPICGTPRPERPMTLAVKLMNAYDEFDDSDISAFKRVAKAAEDHYFGKGKLEALADHLGYGSRSFPQLKYPLDTAERAIEFLKRGGV